MILFSLHSQDPCDEQIFSLFVSKSAIFVDMLLDKIGGTHLSIDVLQSHLSPDQPKHEAKIIICVNC